MDTEPKERTLELNNFGISNAGSALDSSRPISMQIEFMDCRDVVQAPMAVKPC